LGEVFTDKDVRSTDNFCLSASVRDSARLRRPDLFCKLLSGTLHVHPDGLHRDQHHNRTSGVVYS
jgi:hypothetical protein